VNHSYAVLERLVAMPQVAVQGVVTRRASPINADFRSLEPLAERIGCPLLLVEGNDQAAMAAFLKSQAPDVVFCVGWSYLLGPDILAIPPRGVVGYHPSALPRNRGRHPLIWALALGLNETGSTYFLMDARADAGPILSQRLVPIGPQDDAASLYVRITATALGQLEELVPALADGALRGTPQDEAQATYWRKRGRADGRIDWRMSAEAIHDLVRALARPYVGAHCEVEGREVRVWKAEIGPPGPPDLEPGRVLAADPEGLVVKCGHGTVRLIEHEFDSLPAVGSCL
jgi:methionyl-tRNA formyltransferase